MLRRVLIDAVQFCFLYRNFALHYSERLASIHVWRMDRRFVLTIRVKVNSKSELVEGRKGKSVLYSVICCCDDRLLSRAVTCGQTI